MQANLTQLNSLFSTFDNRVKPVTMRIRAMLLHKKFNLQPQPTQEQLDRDLDEFNNRILPMFEHQLDGKKFFCGQDITGYDLQVYCEINSVLVFADDLIRESLESCSNIQSWMKLIKFIPEVQEVESKFEVQAADLL